MKVLWSIAVVLVVAAVISQATKRERDAPRPAVEWPAGTETPPQPGRQWSLYQGRDSMDDSPAADLSVNGTPIPNSIGRMVATRLWISCRRNTTRFFVETDTFLDTESLRVEYRIDDRPAKRETWRVSTDYTAIGRWSGAVPLVKTLFDATTFRVAFVPHGDPQREVTFDVTGLRDRIEPVAAACNWKP